MEQKIALVQAKLKHCMNRTIISNLYC